jgi:hypothetical protein
MACGTDTAFAVVTVGAVGGWGWGSPRVAARGLGVEALRGHGGLIKGEAVGGGVRMRPEAARNSGG